MPMQAQRRGGGIFSTFSQPGSRRRWLGSTTHRPLCPRKDPYTFYRGMGGLLSQPPGFMRCRQSTSKGAVFRSLFVDYEIIKETNYIKAWFAVQVPLFFLSFQIPLFMVSRDGKFSSYDADNKSFPPLFYFTQTATIYTDTRIKGLYITVLLGHSRVHSLSITHISQHGKETSLLAGTSSDYQRNVN